MPEKSVKPEILKILLSLAEQGSFNSEQTIITTMAVLRSKLMKHGDLYNGFLASIESVLKPKERYIGDREFGIHAEKGANYLSKEILSRIIGEE